MSIDHLSMWTVYENPKDYPGKFVVRESRVMRGGHAEVAAEPAAVEPSLYEARMKGVPRWATRLERAPQDDPVIVEVWI